MAENFFTIKESELKQVTLYLIKSRTILHPIISPDGSLNFWKMKRSRYVLIVDRNILIPIIFLGRNGYLKDERSLRLIGCLMIWSHVNGISMTSGLALSEYAHHLDRDDVANRERELFLRVFDFYHPKVWLDIALGQRKTIEPLSSGTSFELSYNLEFEHYKMHYLEMLIIAQSYFDKSLSQEQKIKSFQKWAYDNLLISRYTMSFLLLLIAGRLKTFKRAKGFEEVLDRCRNQAWDLSYLTLWGALRVHEHNRSVVYLFGTRDEELKMIFMSAHIETNELPSDLFGSEVGNRISQFMRDTFKERKVPSISSEFINTMIRVESEKLKFLLETLVGE